MLSHPEPQSQKDAALNPPILTTSRLNPLQQCSVDHAAPVHPALVPITSFGLFSKVSPRAHKSTSQLQSRWEANPGHSKASQALWLAPSSEITLAEDSSMMKSISVTTAGTPHSEALFWLLLLIWKYVNVHSSTWASIFLAAWITSSWWGVADTGWSCLHKHWRCLHFQGSSLQHSFSTFPFFFKQGKPHFPVPLSSFTFPRHDLLVKKSEIFSSAQYLKKPKELWSNMCNFFTQKKK